MEIHKAKEIVQALAAGINPTTGELFPSDSPYKALVQSDLSLTH
jgi:hypothetical protein